MYNRILAITKQEIFITKHSFEVIVDIIVYPLISILVFGWLSLYLLGNTEKTVAHSIMIGIVLWQIIFVTTYSIAVAALWNIWWRNLSNLFVTPLAVSEYMIAVTISSFIKSMIIGICGAVISYFVFGFALSGVGLINLFLFLVILLIFGFSLGIMVLGLIFRYGTRVQALAWGLIPLLQPLTAAFYPVSVLPQPIQYISYALPPTYIFEAVRKTLSDGAIHYELIVPGFILDLLLLGVSLFYFQYMFQKAKITGQFARNEG